MKPYRVSPDTERPLPREFCIRLAAASPIRTYEIKHSADADQRTARAGGVPMLVNLHVHPVADPEIVEGSTHRAHGAGLANLDVRLGWERDGDLASIVER